MSPHFLRDYSTEINQILHAPEVTKVLCIINIYLIEANFCKRYFYSLTHRPNNLMYFQIIFVTWQDTNPMEFIPSYI